METPQVGGPGLIVVYAILFALLGAAFWNLWNFQSRPIVTSIASVFWLLFVGWFTYFSLCEEGGPTQYLINRLGQFGSKQFVCIERHRGEAAHVCFGYRLFGQRLHYLKVRSDHIEYVCWNSGQATALAGRDMNDWNVIVWYKEPPSKSGWLRGTPLTPKGLYILGPCGPKETIARFGVSFVQFLVRAEIVLFPTEGGCRYVPESPIDQNAISITLGADSDY